MLTGLHTCYIKHASSSLLMRGWKARIFYECAILHWTKFDKVITSHVIYENIIIYTYFIVRYYQVNLEILTCVTVDRGQVLTLKYCELNTTTNVWLFRFKCKYQTGVNIRRFNIPKNTTNAKSSSAVSIFWSSFAGALRLCIASSLKLRWRCRLASTVLIEE